MESLTNIIKELIEYETNDFNSSTTTPVQKMRILIYNGCIDIFDIPQSVRVKFCFVYKSALYRATHLPSKELYYHVKKILEGDIAFAPTNTDLLTIYHERVELQPWDYWERFWHKPDG